MNNDLIKRLRDYAGNQVALKFIHEAADAIARDLSKSMNTKTLIAEECDALKAMLLEKNRKYGDSALNPVRFFSSASPLEQIRVRIDDKLSRLKSGQTDDKEDTKQDLIGYLILERVAQRKQVLP